MPSQIKPRRSGVVDLRRPAGPAGSLAPATKPRAKGYASLDRGRAKKGSGLLTFLIVLLVLLVASALASFFLFDSVKTGRSLKMTLSAPKTAVSGEEVSLEIIYENLDKVPLEKMELVIQYPDGFYFDSANLEPYNHEKNQWQLANLAVGESGSLTVMGQLMGQVKADKEFSVVFHYQPSNFNSDFSETIAKSVKLTDTLFNVSLTAPEKIEDGQELAFKADYENRQAVDLAGLKFAFELSEGFLPTYLSPTTTGYFWNVDRLAPGQKDILEVKGKVDSAKSNPFSWSFKVWQEADVNGQIQQRIWHQASGEVEIVAPQLEIAVAKADSESKLNWGEAVDLKIVYKNTGKLDVKEAVLKLALNDLIDWSKYSNLTGAIRDKNTLIWLSKSSPAASGLSSIPQGQSGELTISLPLAGKPEDLAQLNAEELILEAAASISVRFNDADKVFTGEAWSEALASEAGLEAEARYYLDAQTKVGRGPLPPEIGQETGYRVYWKVFSGSTGLTDLKIKTSLPSYINWQGEADSPTLGSNLVFDEASRQVVWEIVEVSPNSQLLASFDLAVVPSEAQVNQLLILTNSTSFTAEAKATGSLVSKTADLLTSDLIGDPLAQGNGRVKVGQ